MSISAAFFSSVSHINTLIHSSFRTAERSRMRERELLSERSHLHNAVFRTLKSGFCILCFLLSSRSIAITLSSVAHHSAS